LTQYAAAKTYHDSAETKGLESLLKAGRYQEHGAARETVESGGRRQRRQGSGQGQHGRIARVGGRLQGSGQRRRPSIVGSVGGRIAGRIAGSTAA